MALVTVHRSPSPISDGQHIRIHGSSNAEGDGGNTLKSLAKNQGLSESYLAVKGAALILTQTECSKSRSCETGKGDIQVHLQLMLYLLRVQDKLKLAVKLENKNSASPTSTSTTNAPTSSSSNPPSPRSHCRYMALVSSQVEGPIGNTNGTTVNSNLNRTSGEVDVILGIDIQDSVATVGLVLPIKGDFSLCLDGDGGFNVSTDGCLHNFKPVSVQAMWAALQCLIKVRDSAIRNSAHVPPAALDCWSSFYSSMIKSEPSFVCEWHATLESTVRDEGLLSLGTSAQRPEDTRLEKTIRTKLKQVMMTVDLEEVTSKYLREKLEEDLGVSLSAWKRFIDDEMIVIMRQMDAPSEILPYLYLGSEWNASNLEELQNNKVGYILNVTREIANFYPDTFKYCNVRIFDEEDSDLLKHWENTHKFISKARDNNSKVLVHCKMGVSRSASTVIAFVMKEMKMSLQEAIKYVKLKRSCIQPNHGFREQLETYEGILDASKQRHSRLWQSSSSIDLQDNLTIPVSKPIQIDNKSSPGSNSSPSTSPSSSTISCDHLKSYESELSHVNADNVGFADNCVEISKSPALKMKDRKRTYHISSSSDNTNVFEAITKNLRANRFAPSPSDKKTSVISKSKSFLSICEHFQTSLKDLYDRKPCFYSRSRSVSPKSHTFKSLHRQDDFRILPSNRSYKSPSSFEHSSKDSSRLRGRLSKKNESFSSRVRPDNFWIRDEPMNINGIDQDVVEEGQSSGQVEASQVLDKSALTDFTSGKVKRTKHEIENRERTMITSNVDSSKKQDKNAMLPQVQRSSSFKLERSKCIGHEVEKRKTYPLSNNFMNGNGMAYDLAASRKGSSSSSSHSCNQHEHDQNISHPHSKSTLDIQSSVGSKHSSASDDSEVFTARREGAKVWMSSNKFKTSTQQLKSDIASKPLPGINNSKISTNSNYQTNDARSLQKGESENDIRSSFRSKRSLNFKGNFDDRLQKAYSIPTDNSLGILPVHVSNGSNAIIFRDVARSNSADSKSVSTFYLELENESLQDEDICASSCLSDLQEASLTKCQSKKPHSSRIENRLPSFATECNATPKVFQAVCHKNVKKVESPVIFLPSAKPVFSIVPDAVQGSLARRPQELGVIRLNTSKSSGNLVETEFEGFSKQNLSKEFVSRHIEENFSICSAMTPTKRSMCNFSISFSNLAPTKTATPVVCKSLPKEDPVDDHLAFSSTIVSNNSNSCSKPSTPTYHVEQSLLCQ